MKDSKASLYEAENEAKYREDNGIQKRKEKETMIKIEKGTISAETGFFTSFLFLSEWTAPPELTSHRRSVPWASPSRNLFYFLRDKTPDGETHVLRQNLTDSCEVWMQTFVFVYSSFRIGRLCVESV